MKSFEERINDIGEQVRHIRKQQNDFPECSLADAIGILQIDALRSHKEEVRKDSGSSRHLTPSTVPEDKKEVENEEDVSDQPLKKKHWKQR